MKLPVLNLGDNVIAVNHNPAVQSIEATCSKGNINYLIPHLISPRNHPYIQR